MPQPKKKFKPPRNLKEFLADLSEERIIEMLDLASSKENIDSVALTHFSEVMEEYGEALYREFRVMSGCQAYASRFQLFSKDSKKGWRVTEVQTGDPVFGYTTLECVAAELKALAGKGQPAEPTVAGLLLASPTTPDAPFLLFSLFSDAAGNLAMSFGLEQGFRWAALDSPSVQSLLNSLLTAGPRLKPEYFDEIAHKLIIELEARLSGAPEGDTVAWLGNWLRVELRELGNESMSNMGKCCEGLFRAVDRLLEAHKATLLEHVAGLEKTHSKQTKRLKSQLDKSELMASGIQARARRLDAELKTLRKQLQKATAAPAPVQATSIGQALDLLFS